MINEQDAVRRCQSGDREAFRPIVEYYGDVLMGTLYLMTHDRALNVKARRQLSVEPLPETDQGSTDPEFGYVDDKDEVRRALSQLSDGHQRVVALRYFADLSTGEVADALGVREGTVKSRLSRALEHLREILADCEDET